MARVLLAQPKGPSEYPAGAFNAADDACCMNSSANSCSVCINLVSKVAFSIFLHTLNLKQIAKEIKSHVWANLSSDLAVAKVFLLFPCW